MLWLIRGEGIEGRKIRRKDIQRLIATWFEMSGPTITRAPRAMSRPPLSLIRLTERPYSAREKVVTLTAKGERFLTTKVEQERNCLRPLLAKLSPEEIHNGLAFFRNGLLILNDAAVRRLGADTKPREAGGQKA
jgi:DNA-binding MarR family transcriptional regulator